MSLKKIRKKIDGLDSQLLKILNERMELAIQSRKFKNKTEDKTRENELLQRLKKDLGRLIDPSFCDELYQSILKKSKELQDKNYKIIAFQGEHGAYSEIASRIWSSDYIPIPCKEFDEVFEGINSNKFDFGIVPVENTLGGVVGQVNDLIINNELFIVGAVDLPVHHCLLALPGTDYRDIRTVYSHTQALAQCRHFLTRNKLESMPFYDTAGAARWLAIERPKAAAVIASSLAADLYNLEIIKENTEDLRMNKTRFLIISKDENKEIGDKCSIIFSTEHKAGTLFNVLESFAKKNINLSRIESVPSKPGSYVFFLDFFGSQNEEKTKEVIEKVKSATSEFKILGFYKERKVDA